MADGGEINAFLEHQYSPSKWIVRSLEDGIGVIEHFFEIGSKAREKAITECTCDLDLKYTNGKNTKLDIYYPKNTISDMGDVLIFIHGGYWQEGSKEKYAFLAAQVNALDCILIMTGYDLAPQEPIDNIVKQVRSAVEFTAKKFPEARLFLCGHSAGAHLCAMMLSMDWDISIKNRLTGIFLVSGIYDLQPLLSTSINEPLKLNEESARSNSPMLIQSKELGLNCRVLVAVGEHESPEFHRQSQKYYELLQEKLASVTYLQVDGVDHFDIFEECVKEDFCLIKEVHDFMKRR